MPPPTPPTKAQAVNRPGRDFAKSVLEKVLTAVVVAAILAIPFRDVAIYIISHVSPDSSVPVGTILPYWGAVSDIPADYEICDGGPPTKPGARLRGDKPKLTDTFLRGAPKGIDDVRSDSARRGGTDETPLFQSETDAVSLTIAQMPTHQHVIPLTHQQEGNFFGSGPDRERVPVSTAIVHHPPFLSSPAGEGKPHAHGFSVPAHTNLPTYQEVFFIIKVR